MCTDLPKTSLLDNAMLVSLIDNCVPTCNHEMETLALLSYFLGVYKNLLEHAHFHIFFSLMPAAKAQASLCMGISSTEHSLLENAITVHCEISQIKHWNINKRVIRTYFLNKGCYWKHTIITPIQCLHCLLDTKMILNHGLRVSNGLDTDHD